MNQKKQKFNFANKIRTFIGLLCCAAMVQPVSAWADYPEKVVRLVHPYAGGGAGDMLTRELAEGLKTAFNGAAVITENKPGAGTIVGTVTVATAPPDGYNLLMIGPATHVIMPLINPKIPYNARKDFEIIGMWGVIGSMISVNAATPVHSVRELVDYAKKNPGKLNYSSAGAGTGPHLGGEMFKDLTGAPITHIPYKGASPAVLALVSGEVEVSFVNTPPQVPFVKSGKIRPLAVTTSQRSPLLPDVPTAAEAGIPGFLSESWYGVAAPAGTPADVRAKILRGMRAAATDPARRARLGAAGIELRVTDAKELIDYIDAEEKRLKPVLTRLDIKME
ncbi:Bug family tripartite tricarboxylate transporter substrate binding protein [Ottowia thiooxydans]|uniref:Tripartite-type tricarboxylate transporter receptor subunit TctC n=1 Tax=Ottowia thiooxydans TaxID=219182 RepID=A0ABV2Q6P5_9BURK